MHMVMGNTVAKPLRPTPCSASFHHSNRGTPNRSMAGEPFIISFAFSSSVSRFIKSSTRCSFERLVFWKGSCWACILSVAAIARERRSLIFILYNCIGYFTTNLRPSQT